MTKEDKELLLNDLCARLPYGVKCDINDNKPYTLSSISNDDYDGTLIRFKEQKNGFNMEVYLSEIKPYLFPLSSLTEEQFDELKEYSGLKYSASLLELVSWSDTHSTLEFWLEETPSYIVIKVFDWLNKNHFDYRNLIEKGLVIDATGLNIY